MFTWKTYHIHCSHDTTQKHTHRHALIREIRQQIWFATRFFFRYLSTLSLQLHCCVYMDKNAEVSAARAHLYSDQMPQTHTWKASPHDTHDMSSLRWMPRPFVHSRFVRTHTHTLNEEPVRQRDKGEGERESEKQWKIHIERRYCVLLCLWLYECPWILVLTPPNIYMPFNI